MNEFLQQPRNKLLQPKEKAVADVFSKCKIKPKNTALFKTENVNQNHNVKLNHKAKTFNIKQAKNITGTDAIFLVHANGSATFSRAKTATSFSHFSFKLQRFRFR